MSSHSVTPSAPPDGWVPVERRLLGLDRATIAPALVVVALTAVAVWLLPTLNGHVVRTDVARSGDVIRVGDAVTFTPTPGWNILTGEREGAPEPSGRYAETAAVSHGGVVLQVRTDTFDGTPAQLLAQLKRTGALLRGTGGYRVTGATSAIEAGEGQRGVAARFSGTAGNGLIAAFVTDGHGVSVVAVGPEGGDPATTTDVDRMIRSLRPVASGAGS